MKLISTQCNAYYACYLKCLTSQESHCTHYIDQANKRKKKYVCATIDSNRKLRNGKITNFQIYSVDEQWSDSKKRKKLFCFRGIDAWPEICEIDGIYCQYSNTNWKRRFFSTFPFSTLLETIDISTYTNR